MRRRITEVDYIKANRKAAREDEIRLYGKQISNRTVVQKSKRMYNRQRDKKVPLFLYFTVIFVNTNVKFVNPNAEFMFSICYIQL